MDECLDSLYRATVLTMLDANSSCWQVTIEDTDKNEIAFISQHGLYCFVRVPIGLESAPGPFHSTMNLIVSSIKLQNVLVYLDDIIIFSKTLEQHIEHDSRVHSPFYNAGATLELKKCSLVTYRTNNPGPVIRPRRFEHASQTTNAIQELKPPVSIINLRFFLGLYNIFRRFVACFGQIVSQLNQRKTELKQFAPLNNKELQTMDTLNNAPISPPVLAFPYPEKHMTLDKDVCNVQISASYSKSSQAIQQNLFITGHTCSPIPSNNATPRNEIESPLSSPYYSSDVPRRSLSPNPK